MCGIAGIVTASGNPKHDIQQMLSAIAYRGPDAQGAWTGESNGLKICLGSRRLAIIDLSPLGKMPMSDAEGTLHITYNGEIYNFQELRQELEARGYRFRSRTDTEVILYAYREWGRDCVRHFNGMFAIALYDERRHQLTLFRDRLGKKPLYCYRQEGLFLFASELKALMAHPGFPRQIDKGGLEAFITLGWIPSPYCIFSNTQKVPPGSYLVYDVDGQNVTTGRYWDPIEVFKEQRPISEKEAVDQAEELLSSSVRYRLISDVPVGILLSGGVDSSVVAALATKASPHMRTFNVDFVEKEHSEGSYAEEIARHLGTDHRSLVVSNEDVQETVKLVPKIYDEPFAYNVGLSTYLAFKMCREQAVVVLTGDGGDETFWGYVPGDYFRFQRTLPFMAWPRFARSLMAGSLALTSQSPLMRALPWRASDFLVRASSFAKGLDIASTPLQAYVDIVTNRVFHDMRTILEEPGEHPIRFFDQSRLSDPSLAHRLDLACLFDFCYTIPDYHMVRVDRASMQSSLEARNPFLDYRVVEFVLRLPLSIKYKNKTPKYLSKEILRKSVPPAMWDRRKQGFGAPLNSWLSGTLRPQLYDIINSFDWPIGVKRQALLRYADAHVAGKEDNTRILWPFFVLALWWDEWMRAKPSGTV